MSRNLLILIIAMCVCATATTIAVVATGHLDQGLELGKYCAGGILTFSILAFFFGDREEL